MPYREPHEVALQAWVESTLAEWTGHPDLPSGHVVRCYYSDQGHARQTRPYATLLVIGNQADGEDSTETIYDSGADTISERLISRRSGNASIQIFGPRHGEMCRTLEHSLFRDSVRVANRNNGLTVAYVSTPARRLSIDTDNVPDDRSLIEFRFRFVDTAEYDAGGNFFENMELTQE